jgi:LmbE family N-acetylglucosaminyl deacetylase
LEQKCLLAVYAHPDDEVFGTGGVLRKYSDEGVRTALICATRGEAGEIADPALATPQTIARVREGELRESSRILGVEDLMVLGYHDGRLAEADPEEVQGRLVREMRRLRPQVVVTFDAAGVYGHPDHRAIHRLTVGAFHQAGDPTCYPEQIAGGVQPYAPQKLYVTASSQSNMRQTRALVLAAGYPYAPGGNAATLALEEMGTPDDEITTCITLSDREYAAKLEALRAHRTQISPTSYWLRMADELRPVRGVERFVLLYPPGAPTDQSETDLFAGVRL